MSDLGLHTPKFRTVGRLTDWVRRRRIAVRLSPDREQVFFKTAKDDPKSAATHLVKYAEWVGPLDAGLENLLRADPACVMAYGEVIARRFVKLPDHLHSCLAGNYQLLIRLVRHLSGTNAACMSSRLSPELEGTIFDDLKYPDLQACEKARASRAASYAEHVGKLDKSMEDIICGNADQILKYASVLKRVGQTLPQEMMLRLSGNSSSLYNLARNHIGGRLPSELEDSMDDPESLYNYAKNVVKGRLPEHLELVFLKDHRHALRYAFDVVRAFASVRLPDELHAMLILKSYENPNDMDIKHYVRETEKCDRKT